MINIFIAAFALSGWAFADDCFQKAQGMTVKRIHDMMEEDAIIENAKVSNLKMAVDKETNNGQTSVTAYYSFDLNGEFNGPVSFSFIGELEFDPKDCGRTLGLPRFHQVETLKINLNK